MMAHEAADLSWAEDRPLRTAGIVYDTRFGKTRRVAEAMARGIRSEGISTDVLSVAEAEQRPIDGFDLLVIGSPSTHLAASPAMQEFLTTLKRMPQLKGHYGFAFDTRVRHHTAGAGRQIESALVRAGLRIPGPRAFATVLPPSGVGIEPPSTSADSQEYRLEQGTEDRFEKLGSRLVRLIRGEIEASSP